MKTASKEHISDLNIINYIGHADQILKLILHNTDNKINLSIFRSCVGMMTDYALVISVLAYHSKGHMFDPNCHY
jgi:hypothetical protein